MAVTDEQLLAALEDAEEFENYEGDYFESQVRQVADAIRNIQQEAGEDNPLTFGFEADSEGLIDGGTIGLNPESSANIYVVKYLGLDDMTYERAATGEKQVLAIKAALLDAYDDIRKYATEKGLI